MKKKSLQLLSDRVKEYYKINIQTPYEFVEINAINLLCSNRFDLAAKLLYIDAYVNKRNMEYALSIYERHINAITGYSNTENGQPEKNTINKFTSVFNFLIEDFKVNGFNSTKSIIPISANNIILDGAHRLSCAIYFNQPIFGIKFPHISPSGIIPYISDYNYFKKLYLESSVMDIMALEYIKWKKNIFIACVWPSSSDNNMDIENLIFESFNIVYKNKVSFSWNGFKNFMQQIYGHQSWVGTYRDEFKGVFEKVEACYKRGGKTFFYLFEASSLDKVLELKSRIRELFNIGKHSIHITDNYDETKQIASLIYSSNSIHFLNNAYPTKYPDHYQILDKIAEIQSLEGKQDSFILNLSLSVYGLQQMNSFDIIIDSTIIDREILEGELDDRNLNIYIHENVDMCYDVNLYFTYNGYKYLSLDEIRKNKDLSNLPDTLNHIIHKRKFVLFVRDITYFIKFSLVRLYFKMKLKIKRILQ